MLSMARVNEIIWCGVFYRGSYRRRKSQWNCILARATGKWEGKFEIEQKKSVRNFSLFVADNDELRQRWDQWCDELRRRWGKSGSTCIYILWAGELSGRMMMMITLSRWRKVWFLLGIVVSTFNYNIHSNFIHQCISCLPPRASKHG
jgi:hypothetical protein